MSILSENIKKLREVNNYSQDELGQKLGISGKTISSWENERSEPRMGMIEDLAKIFRCKKSDILGETEIKNGNWIPVLGHVAAGIPIEAVEDIIDYEEISEEMARSGDHFALQIKGDSMEPKFSQGDVVIVKKQVTIDSGQIGIVLVNGHEATCKKITYTESGIMLISTNPSFEPQYYTAEQITNLPVVILGRVVELRAKFK